MKYDTKIKVMAILEPGIVWVQNGNLGIRNVNLLKIKQLSFISKYCSVAHLENQKLPCLCVTTGHLFSGWLPSFSLLMIIFCLVTGNCRDAFDITPLLGWENTCYQMALVKSPGFPEEPRGEAGGLGYCPWRKIISLVHSIKTCWIQTKGRKEGTIKESSGLKLPRENVFL